MNLSAYPTLATDYQLVTRIYPALKPTLEPTLEPTLRNENLTKNIWKNGKYFVSLQYQTKILSEPLSMSLRPLKKSAVYGTKTGGLQKKVGGL